jgi:hypothetical protein
MSDLMNLISAGLGISEGALEVKKNTWDIASLWKKAYLLPRLNSIG